MKIWRERERKHAEKTSWPLTGNSDGGPKLLFAKADFVLNKKWRNKKPFLSNKKTNHPSKNGFQDAWIETEIDSNRNVIASSILIATSSSSLLPKNSQVSNGFLFFSNNFGNKKKSSERFSPFLCWKSSQLNRWSVQYFIWNFFFCKKGKKDKPNQPFLHQKHFL